LVDDPAPQQMAVVRRERVDLVAFGVEREREVLVVLDPVVAVEAPLEIRGLLLEAVGELVVLPDLAREAGGPHLPVVRISLQLARGPREARQLAVPVGDRIPGVLPALVLEAGLLVPALVPDVTVAAEIRVVVDPGERRARLVLEVPDELAVAGPALVLV